LTLQGLLQLEARIPQSMLEAKVMRPNLAKSKSASDNRKLAAILGHLGAFCIASCTRQCAVVVSERIICRQCGGVACKVR
jgi:hypothetical protein